MGSETTLRAGVIGLGIAGQRHLASYAARPDVHIAAVCDLQQDLARKTSEQYGAPWFVDYRELLSQELDAVSICLPHSLLAQAAIAAASMGVHTLLEKPMATSVQQAVAVSNAFRDSESHAMVGYVHRFRDEVMRARELIQAGAIGTPYLIVDQSSLGGDELAPDWIWNRELSGGGVLMYNGVHSLDRLLWLTGADPLRVSAQAKTLTHATDVEDVLLASIELATDQVAQLMIHFPNAADGGHWSTDLYGPEGRLSLQTGRGVQLTSISGKQSIASEDDRRFDREIEEFVEAIKAGREPSPNHTHGIRILQVVEAIYQSAASDGDWVDVQRDQPVVSRKESRT